MRKYIFKKNGCKAVKANQRCKGVIVIWKSEMERNPLFCSYKIAPGIDMGNLIRATHTGLACLVLEYSHYQHCTEVFFERFNMLCHYI